MILSILITSHNQGALLGRCVDSILSQPLPFEYEIIISDDSSIDGTWELAQEYAKHHPQIQPVQCNTDDYHPVNRCQRCGWNQCNAYSHSRGKYFIHVDADDFFCTGTEVLRKQVELLELHPECSCCMADNFILKDGEEFSNAIVAHPNSFQTGEIFSSEKFAANYWRSDHDFVYRRQLSENVTKIYGGYYDDTLITFHNLQFGDVICLNEAGYVYVQYESSIWNEVKSQLNDVVLGCPILYIPVLIPRWKKVMLRSNKHLRKLQSAIEWMFLGGRLEDGNYAYLDGLPKKSRLIRTMNHELRIEDKIYLSLLRLDLKMLKHLSFEPLFWLLFILMKEK